MQQADDGSFTKKFRRTGTQWAGPSPSGRSPLGRSPLGQRGYSATRGSPTPSAAAGWGSRDGPLPTKIEMDTMMDTDSVSRAKQLREPFLPGASSTSSPAEEPTKDSLTRLLGVLMVTAAALLFGVVAAFIKATALPTLVMLMARSLLEWVMGFVFAMAYLRTGGRDMVRVPQAEASKAAVQAKIPAGRFLPSPPPTPGPPSERQSPYPIRESMHDGDGDHRNSEPPMWRKKLALVLIGPPHLRKWVVLRAALYWGFLACWWLALTSMPIGDATTIVYTAPIWTATFARLFLGEKIDWSFYPIVCLDVAGLVLITQPSFLGFYYPPPSTQEEGDDKPSYLLGALSSLTSSIIAGLLPVCTRKSKECVWTAVNHTSSFLSAFLFTPLAFLVWASYDPTAWQQSLDAVGALASRADGGMGKWPLLIGATLTGFAGLALQTLGYQREEAAKASVMTILEIPFAYLLQFFAFGDELNMLGIGGVTLVCCGTMLNLLRHYLVRPGHK